ncbi:MAG: hypothetical protein Q7R83_03520 [bacterium]|nr:hypothetical protein [bacterium]
MPPRNGAPQKGGEPEDIFSDLDQGAKPTASTVSTAMPSMSGGGGMMKYIAIALAVVAALAIIGVGFWFFVIRTATPEVAPTTDVIPSSDTTPLEEESSSVDSAAVDTQVLEMPVIEPLPAPASAEPTEPVTTPPSGTNIPLPTSVAPGAPVCSDINPCASGYTCKNGACAAVISCNTDAQCPIGEACLDGTCGVVTATTPPPASAPAADVTLDTDQDGLTDVREEELGTDPTKSDTDGDNVTDGDEVTKFGTNPINPDTDGDGYPDMVEMKNGYNPRGAGKCVKSDCSL